MDTDMQGLLDQSKEQRIQLENIVAQRKELEKLVEFKEQKLQKALEENRGPEAMAAAEEFRILKIMENHKQKVVELDTLHSSLEHLAILNIETKDRQRDQLYAHQKVMKDLAQKFQSAPSTYMNQEEMTSKLNHLQKVHESLDQQVKCLRQEEARKKALFRQLYPADLVKKNTIAVDGNMPAIMRMISKQKQHELEESKAKEVELLNKLKRLQQLSLLLETNLERLKTMLVG